MLLFQGGAPSTATAAFVNSYVITSNLTAYTFAVTFGAGQTGNDIIVAAHMGGTPRTVSTMTFHVPDVSTDPTGTAMTLVTGAKGSSSSTSTEFWRGGPPGATGFEITVTWSGSALRSALDVWAAAGAASTATATATDSTNPLSQSVSVPAGGFILAAVCGITATSHSWGASLSEVSDELMESSTYHSAAFANFTAATSATVAVTPSTFDAHIMVACSFGPA